MWAPFDWSVDAVCCGYESDSFCSPGFLDDSVLEELLTNSWFEIVFLSTFDLQFRSVHKVGGFGGIWSEVLQSLAAWWDC